MAEREVKITVKFDDANSEAVAARIEKRFAELADASDRSISEIGKSLNEKLSGGFASGGEREYLETIRRLQPELKQLHQSIKNGSFDLADYQRRMQMLDPAMRSALAASLQLGRGFKTIGDEAEHGTNGLGKLLVSLNVLERGADAAIQKLRASAAEAVDLGRSIANIGAITDDSFDLSKAKAQIIALPPELGRASDAARGMYQAISSNVSAADALEFTAKSAMAAKAGLSDVYTTVDASTTVLNSYGIEAKRVAEVYDLMFQTVKNGKIEFPQLAQGIGQVSNIAAQAGVTIEELFAVIATATATTKPAVVMEAYRSALSNIIKPSEQAVKLSEQLGLQFNISALRAKGFSAFLADVMVKTKGNTDQLAVLFGDVQGLNSILSITGAQANNFSKNLDDMKNAFGAADVYGKAFTKQQQSLGAQMDTTGVLIEKSFLKAFSLIEPVLVFVLSVINKYPTPFAVAAIAVGALTAAHLLLNTQLIATAVTTVPSLIRGLLQTITVMSQMTAALLTGNAAMASFSATTIVAFTAGWGLLLGAIGLAAYALYQYSQTQNKTVEEHINGIRAVKGQTDALIQQQQTLNNLQGDVSTLTLKQKELADIYATLDTASKNRVDKAIAEKGAVGALADEIERLNNAKKVEADALLTDLAARTAESYQKMQSAAEAARKAEEIYEQAKAKGLKDYFYQGEVAGGVSVEQQFEMLRKAQLDSAAASQTASKEFEELKGSLQTGSQILGTTADKFVLAKEVTRQLSKTNSDYIQTLSLASNSQSTLTNNLNNTAGATQNLTSKVSDLRGELAKLVSANQANIDTRIFNIVSGAKDKAELIAAAKRAKEDLKNDLQLVNQQKDFLKTATDIIQPSERTTSPRPSRTPNPSADFRRENRVISGNAQWDKWVYEFSKKYGVDSDLIFAQMMQESSFKRNAVSNKGAGGLLQIMPGTFSDIRRQINIGTDRFDPKTNIEAGVFYLRQQLEKFNGNIALALAAYNAGPGRVIAAGNAIPNIKETQDYVKRISLNYKRMRGGAGGFEYGGNFDYERSLQEQSDALTKAERDRVTRAEIEAARLTQIKPDDEVIRDYNRLLVEEARKSGVLQPTLEKTAAEFKNFRTASAIPDEIQSRPLNTRDQRFTDLMESLRITERQKDLDERRVYLSDEILIKQNDYILLLQEAQTDLKVEAALLESRNLQFESANEFARQRNAQTRELGDIEIDLNVLRRQNADNQFVEQRRLLTIKREQIDLEREITQLQDELANGGANDGLRVQSAYLRDVIELRRQEVEAVIAVNRAELEISKSMEISNNKIRARVLEHLASQKSLNDSIADGIIGTYEAVADRAGAALDKLNEKTKGFLSFIIEPAKAMQRNFLTNITRNVLDYFVPGLGTELTKTNNPVAKPIVEEINRSNKLLEKIAINTSGGFGGVVNPAGGSSRFGQFLNMFGLGGTNVGSNQPGFPVAMNAAGDGSTRPRIVEGQPIRSVGSGSFLDNLKNLFSTNEGGIFARRGGDGSPGSGSRLAGIAGGIGDIAAFAGGLIGGRAGGIISSIGTFTSLGATFGPWGAAIGAGVGLIAGILGGDPKRKEDNQQNLPQLKQGFADSIKEFKQLINDLDLGDIRASEALKRSKEIRSSIESGFNIDFKSKKYRRISRQEIESQLKAIDKQPDGLWLQLQAAIQRRKDAEEFQNKFVATFAGGVMMDEGFRAQYDDYKRRNGLMPGAWTGKDYIKALIADGEMVLNPYQQKQIREAAGFDAFAFADLPNYKAPKPPAPVKMAQGAFIGNLGAGNNGNSQSSSGNITCEFKGNIILENFVPLPGAKAYLESPDGRRQVIEIVNDHIETHPASSDGMPRNMKKAMDR